MIEREFLNHSASTPMTELRARFNRGESLYMQVPPARLRMQNNTAFVK